MPNSDQPSSSLSLKAHPLRVEDNLTAGNVKEPRVGIVIVNWNTGNLLAHCLQSLTQLSTLERKLISNVQVVDNNSSDDSMTFAERGVGESSVPIHFLGLKTNSGFAHATNVGVNRIRKDDPGSHIMLLNPDTEVLPGAIHAIVSALEGAGRVGIVGLKLRGSDGAHQPSVRRFPTLGVFVFFFLKLNRVLPASSLWRRYMAVGFDYGRQQNVDQVMGAAFAIHNKLLSEIGELDENFWIWFEEVDYCKRARDAGWQIVYTPAGQVVHHGAVSFNQLTGLGRALPFLRSAMIYSKKHLGIIPWLTLVILWPFSIGLSFLATVFHLANRTYV